MQTERRLLAKISDRCYHVNEARENIATDCADVIALKKHKKRENMKINEHLNCTYKNDVSKNNFVFDLHCHLGYELIFVINGSVIINVEGEKRKIGKNSVIAIEPLKYHTVTASEGENYERIFIEFDQTVIPGEIFSQFTEKIRTYPTADDAEITSAFYRLKDILNRYDEKFAPLAISCLIRIFYAFTFRNDEAVQAPRVTPLVSKIVDYIALHLTEKITLKDISANLYQSVSTLCHVFKSEMKTGIKQYIMQKKLSYAAELIRGGATASAAAHAIGYDNYVNFYNAYKKIIGCLPSQALNPDKEKGE